MRDGLFSKTQRVLLKRGGGTNLEIALSDDSFSDRNPQKGPDLTNSRQIDEARSVLENRCNKGN